MILFFNLNDGIDKYLHDAVYPVIGFKSLSAETQDIGMLGETTRHLDDRISGCTGRLREVRMTGQWNYSASEGVKRRV